MGSTEEDIHFLKEGLLYRLSPFIPIRISGKESFSFLQSVLTQDLKKFDSFPNQGLGSFALDAKGKWQASFLLFKTSQEEFLALTSIQEWELVQKVWSPLLLFSEVKLEKLSPPWSVFEVLGEGIPSLLSFLASSFKGSLNWEKFNALEKDFLFIHYYSLPYPSCLILGPSVDETFLTSLFSHISLSSKTMEASTQEWFRLEAGEFRFGKDVQEQSLTAEVDREDWISYTKGCYLGQETVSRLKHYGRANKKSFVLTLAESSDSLDSELWIGRPVFSDGQEVGKISSSAYSPLRKTMIFRASLKREAWEKDLECWGKKLLQVKR